MCTCCCSLRKRMEHVVPSRAKLGQNLWSVLKDFVYAHDLAAAQPLISINCLSTFLQQIKLALKGHFSGKLLFHAAKASATALLISFSCGLFHIQPKSAESADHGLRIVKAPKVICLWSAIHS